MLKSLCKIGQRLFGISMFNAVSDAMLKTENKINIMES